MWLSPPSARPISPPAHPVALRYSTYPSILRSPRYRDLFIVFNAHTIVDMTALLQTTRQTLLEAEDRPVDWMGIFASGLVMRYTTATGQYEGRVD